MGCEGFHFRRHACQLQWGFTVLHVNVSKNHTGIIPAKDPFPLFLWGLHGPLREQNLHVWARLSQRRLVGHIQTSDEITSAKLEEVETILNGPDNPTCVALLESKQRIEDRRRTRR